MANQVDKITRREMREALLRSGYLLESRVESKLLEGWGYVQANATYPDPETGKSREFDLYAMNANRAGPDDLDFLFGVLLIECINNPQPLVILTREPLVGFLHSQEIKMAGLPVKVPYEGKNDEWQQLIDFLKMENYHHYCKGRVGTQFCSFLKKKSGNVQEWMATHEGPHFDSFRKLGDIVDYYMEEHFKNWSFGSGRENLNIEVYHPVIILQGDLLEARETKRSVTFRTTDHIQFRRSVATKGREADYQIDVITERYLDNYIQMVSAELQKTARLLRRRHKVIRAAIETIAAHAKAAATEEEMRKAMDF